MGLPYRVLRAAMGERRRERRESPQSALTTGSCQPGASRRAQPRPHPAPPAPRCPEGGRRAQALGGSATQWRAGAEARSVGTRVLGRPHSHTEKRKQERRYPTPYSPHHRGRSVWVERPPTDTGCHPTRWPVCMRPWVLRVLMEGQSFPLWLPGTLAGAQADNHLGRSRRSRTEGPQDPTWAPVSCSDAAWVPSSAQCLLPPPCGQPGVYPEGPQLCLEEAAPHPTLPAFEPRPGHGGAGGTTPAPAPHSPWASLGPSPDQEEDSGLGGSSWRQD